MSTTNRHIAIHYVSTTRQSPVEVLLKDFYARLNRFIRFTEHRIRGLGDSRQAMKQEAEAILQRWPASGKCVALSRKGRRLNNETWLRFLSDQLHTPPGSIHFFVGGASGLHDSVIEKMDDVIGFSDLTIAHSILRLVLVEQIYRALTRMHGIKYHKAPG